VETTRQSTVYQQAPWCAVQWRQGAPEQPIVNGDERESITIDRTHYPPYHILNNRGIVDYQQVYRIQLQLRLELWVLRYDKTIDRSQHRHGTTIFETFDNNKGRVSRTSQYKNYMTRNLSTAVVVWPVHAHSSRSIKAFERALFHSNREFNREQLCQSWIELWCHHMTHSWTSRDVETCMVYTFKSVPLPTYVTNLRATLCALVQKWRGRQSCVHTNGSPYVG
jgi:hypothetical protein